MPVLAADIHSIQRCLADRVLAGHHSRLLEAEHRVRSEARAVGYRDLAYPSGNGLGRPSSLPARRPWTSLHDRQQEDEVSHGTRGFHQERNWRKLERSAGAAAGDIEISRWTDLPNTSRPEEATTPADRYFIGIAL